jgi:hypothetical protein
VVESALRPPSEAVAVALETRWFRLSPPESEKDSLNLGCNLSFPDGYQKVGVALAEFAGRLAMGLQSVRSIIKIEMDSKNA